MPETELFPLVLSLFLEFWVFIRQICGKTRQFMSFSLEMMDVLRRMAIFLPETIKVHTIWGKPCRLSDFFFFLYAIKNAGKWIVFLEVKLFSWVSIFFLVFFRVRTKKRPVLPGVIGDVFSWRDELFARLVLLRGHPPFGRAGVGLVVLARLAERSLQPLAQQPFQGLDMLVLVNKGHDLHDHRGPLPNVPVKKRCQSMSLFSTPNPRIILVLK